MVDSKDLAKNIIEKGGLSFANQVLQDLQTLLDKDVAIVYYAGEENAQSSEQKVKDFLNKKFNKTPKINFVKDENLIGGIRIEYKDYVYEDSVKQRLQSIKK